MMTACRCLQVKGGHSPGAGLAVNARAKLAECYGELGMFAEGRALGDEGLQIAEAVGHPASRMMAAWGSGVLALRQGDLPRALALLTQAVSICQDADLPFYLPGVAVVLGAVHSLAGRWADAVPLLTQTLTQTMGTDMVGFQALCGLALGEAQLLAGHLEEAYILSEPALAFAQAHQQRGSQAYALRLLGELAMRHKPLESSRAEAYYRQALALAETLGMRPLQAHCHRGLGTLYATTGQAEQARAALSTAIALYRAMHMPFWLPQTETALAQMRACSNSMAG
jgi:tetratricopeptide (TPR) repeat protein